jgi:hypothetical protein
MSSRAEHNEDCIKKFGKPYDHVNKWLDGCAPCKNFEGVDCLDMNHRIHRHHKEAVEHVREEWGDEAAEAAELHIITDMGCILSQKDMEEESGKAPQLIPWEVIFGEEHTEDS